MQWPLQCSSSLGAGSGEWERSGSVVPGIQAALGSGRWKISLSILNSAGFCCCCVCFLIFQSFWGISELLQTWTKTILCETSQNKTSAKWMTWLQWEMIGTEEILRKNLHRMCTWNCNKPSKNSLLQSFCLNWRIDLVCNHLAVRINVLLVCF